MCLATPLKVIKLNKNKASVDALGEEKEVDVSLLASVKVGDYLYASRDLAIRKIARQEAEKILKLVEDWNERKPTK